jgi:hypothetical protein
MRAFADMELATEGLVDWTLALDIGKQATDAEAILYEETKKPVKMRSRAVRDLARPMCTTIAVNVPSTF